MKIAGQRMADVTTGGCFCGCVRYEIAGEPAMQVLCFCRDCLKTSGTAGYAGYMVNTSDFRVVSGEPKVHERTSKEGRTVKRHFCSECGSNLFGVTEFGLSSVAAGTLDNPEVFHPTAKCFVDDAPHWARVPAELEKL